MSIPAEAEADSAAAVYLAHAKNNLEQTRKEQHRVLRYYLLRFLMGAVDSDFVDSDFHPARDEVAAQQQHDDDGAEHVASVAHRFAELRKQELRERAIFNVRLAHQTCFHVHMHACMHACMYV